MSRPVTCVNQRIMIPRQLSQGSVSHSRLGFQSDDWPSRLEVMLSLGEVAIHSKLGLQFCQRYQNSYLVGGFK